MGVCVMATLGDVATPLERFSVMVQRWGFPFIKMSVPAFSQEDAIDRIVGEANRGNYYNFMKAYAPEKGSGRQENDGNSSGS